MSNSHKVIRWLILPCSTPLLSANAAFESSQNHSSTYALQRDDAAPSTALFEARGMFNQLCLARLASGANLSRELFR
jgi:hypothetical protein